LSGQYSLVKAARTIREMGPKYLVIKKGEHGALLFYNEHVFFMPALPLEEVFDPTGAGDSFAGGFMGYLAKTGDISHESMKRALVYGSVTASFCVEAFGPNRLKEINPSDLHARTLEFLSLMDVTVEEIR
jgi:sugar/nucleoside kinase (ribokinase family)